MDLEAGCDDAVQHQAHVADVVLGGVAEDDDVVEEDVGDAPLEALQHLVRQAGPDAGHRLDAEGGAQELELAVLADEGRLLDAVLLHRHLQVGAGDVDRGEVVRPVHDVEAAVNEADGVVQVVVPQDLVQLPVVDDEAVLPVVLHDDDGGGPRAAAGADDVVLEPGLDLVEDELLVGVGEAAGRKGDGRAAAGVEVELDQVGLAHQLLAGSEGGDAGADHGDEQQALLRRHVGGAHVGRDVELLADGQDGAALGGLQLDAAERAVLHAGVLGQAAGLVLLVVVSSADGARGGAEGGGVHAEVQGVPVRGEERLADDLEAGAHAVSLRDGHAGQLPGGKLEALVAEVGEAGVKRLVGVAGHVEDAVDGEADAAGVRVRVVGRGLEGVLGHGDGGEEVGAGRQRGFGDDGGVVGLAGLQVQGRAEVDQGLAGRVRDAAEGDLASVEGDLLLLLRVAVAQHAAPHVQDGAHVLQ